MDEAFAGVSSARAGQISRVSHELPKGAEILEWEQKFANNSHDVIVRLRHGTAGDAARSSELLCVESKAGSAHEAGICLLPTPSEGVVYVELDNSKAYLYEARVAYSIKVTSDAALAVEDGHATSEVAKSELERNERVLREVLTSCPPGTTLSPGVIVPRAEWSSNRIDAADTVAANRAGEFGVGLFFLNRFAASEGFFARQSDRVPLFALGQSTLSYLRAILTWQRSDIDQAITMLHSAHRVAKDASPTAGSGAGIVGGLMWLVGATDDGTGAGKGELPLARAGREIESLLVRAESSLILAVMYLMQESAVGVLRAGLSVRSAYLFYQEAETKLKRVTSKQRSKEQQEGLSDLSYAWADSSPADAAREDEDDLSDLPHAKDDIISILTGKCKPAMDPTHSDIDADGGGIAGASAPVVPAAASGGGGGSTSMASESSEAGASPRGRGGESASAEAASHFQRLEKAVELGESLGLSRSVASGISFGLGVFNIFASAMPPILLRLVDLLGYPHDRKLGLRLLRRTVRAGGVRAPLAALVILIAEVLIPGFLPPSARTRLKEAEHIMAYLLHMYPSSVIFLWLAGRLLRMLGRPEEAQQVFEMINGRERGASSAAGSASDAPPEAKVAPGMLEPPAAGARIPLAEPLPKYLGHVVLYESGLCNLSLFRFDEAGAQFERLSAENTWSRAFYYHMRIVCTLGKGRLAAAANELAPTVAGLLERKVGGKLISAEQYAYKRSTELCAYAVARSGAGAGEKARAGTGLALARTRGGSVWSCKLNDTGVGIDQTGRVHPACRMAALELLYLWNTFGQVSRAIQLYYLGVIDSFIAHLSTSPSSDPGACMTIEYVGGESHPMGEVSGDARTKLTAPIPAAELLSLLMGACACPVSASRCTALLAVPVEGAGGGSAADDARVGLVEEAKLRKDRLPDGWLDDVAVALLLRGTLLAYLGNYADAEVTLVTVEGLSSVVTRDTFAIPYASFELACAREGAGRDAALEKVGSYSKDYNFSLRLKLRAHLLTAFAN